MQPQPRKLEGARKALAALGWSGAATTSAALIVALVLHQQLDASIDQQVDRNRYLAEEIAKVDKEIAEVSKLREYTAAFLARKRVVEALDLNHNVLAGLLDRLARLRGEEIVLRSLSRSGNNITISGAGGTYLDVEAFLRRIGDSGFLEYPRLMEVSTAAAAKDAGSTIQFTVTALLRLEKRGLPDEKPAGQVPGAPK